MTETKTKVRPVSLNSAIYRDKDDNQWYWSLTPSSPESSGEPIGPFRTREDAREDFRVTMGIKRTCE